MPLERRMCSQRGLDKQLISHGMQRTRIINWPFNTADNSILSMEPDRLTRTHDITVIDLVTGDKWPIG